MWRRTASVVLLLLSASARADVPPSPDSPDAHCSLDEQCKAGVLCPYMFQGGGRTPPGEIPVGQACRADAAAKGLERRCRHGGNYGGDEIFCPPGATGTWTRPAAAAPTSSPSAAAEPTKARSSCTTSAASPHGNGAAVLLAGILAAAFARRRRDWRRVSADRSRARA